MAKVHNSFTNQSSCLAGWWFTILGNPCLVVLGKLGIIWTQTNLTTAKPSAPSSKMPWAISGNCSPKHPWKKRANLTEAPKVIGVVRFQGSPVGILEDPPKIWFACWVETKKPSQPQPSWWVAPNRAKEKPTNANLDPKNLLRDVQELKVAPAFHSSYTPWNHLAMIIWHDLTSWCPVRIPFLTKVIEVYSRSEKCNDFSHPKVCKSNWFSCSTWLFWCILATAIP